jgi:lipopolysaccharide/colanic/teichoic acid biosynthesis glycosyltransferase
MMSSFYEISMKECAEKQICISQRNEAPLYFLLKRCFDLAFAVALIILLSPFMLLIALCIRFDSAGPVLFVQERVAARRHATGARTVWELRKFRIYKFRSMFQDADQSVHRVYIEAFVEGRLAPPNGGESMYKLVQDRRVTRVGRFLRKTSLDELPQLINVVRGDMSLVGPRPVPTYEVAQYKPWHYERLSALPGITGFWQVRGRCRVPFDEMVRMDIEYARCQSLWVDLKILLLTIPAVLSGDGAE